MIQGLNLNENLINKINYSLSFSLNNGILSVQRVSYEPLWRKIVLTGLFFIPSTGFLLTTLYCIYAITVDTQYANNCSEALPFLFYSNTIYKYLVFQQEQPGQLSILLYWIFCLKKNSIGKQKAHSYSRNIRFHNRRTFGR